MRIIAVTGHSGAGKSHICKHTYPEGCVLKMDDYYCDYAQVSAAQRTKHVDWDRPETLDWDLFNKHLEKIKNGEAIEKPIYSFASSSRSGYEPFVPKDIVVIEGIHSFRIPDCHEYLYIRCNLLSRMVRRFIRDRKRSSHTAATIIWRSLIHAEPGFRRYCVPRLGEATKIIDNNLSLRELRSYRKRV